MNFILWLVLGSLAGFFARIILGNGMGVWWQDVLLGAFGAIIGGYLAVALGLGPVTGLNLYSLLVAVAGALLLLWVLRLIRRKLG